MADLLKKILTAAGLLLLLIWLLSVSGAGFTAPDWVGPAGAACTAGAVFMIVFFG